MQVQGKALYYWETPGGQTGARPQVSDASIKISMILLVTSM